MKRTVSVLGSILGAAALLQLGGCMSDDLDTRSTGDDVPSFEDFEAGIYREPGTGIYIVNGDEPIHSRELLFDFYQQLYHGDGALIVNTVGGVDDKWSDTAKRNITYCVSNNFGADKPAMVAAMAAATEEGWERAANVDFIYKPEQDASCTAFNRNVVFDVRPVSGVAYTARAFFPSSPRFLANVLVNTNAFAGLPAPITLTGVITHELGHTLGFRHEHTRPEAGTCFENNAWRALTGYDRDSTMHYPQCNGNREKDLTLTDWDRQGASSLYGAPGDDPGGGERTQTFSGSLWFFGRVVLPVLEVQPGTTFRAVLSGTGNPDLYVRWNAEPTATAYDCRPFLPGAAETCELTVPASATTANIAINSRTFLEARYSATVTWTEP